VVIGEGRNTPEIGIGKRLHQPTAARRIVGLCRPMFEDDGLGTLESRIILFFVRNWS